MSLLKSTPNLAGIERHIPSTPLLETCKFYGESTVVSEMNSDFTELASARCDIPNDLVDVTLLHAGDSSSQVEDVMYRFPAQWIDDRRFCGVEESQGRVAS